jgi:formylglycine-generating enzyme required for sulfatase activity
MEVIQRVRVACPRCGSAVTGDFKFCPTCAYRLKPGAARAEPDLAPRPRSLATTLLAVSAALFVALLVGIGVWIFRDQAAGRPTPVTQNVATAPPAEGLRVANLRKYLRRVPPGIAYHFREKDEDGEEVGPWLAWHVDDLDVLIYEVPRSFYAEFLTDMRQRADEPPLPALAPIWDPQTPTDVHNAQLYLGTWMYRFLNPDPANENERRPVPEAVLAFLPEEARKALAAKPKTEKTKPLDDFVEAMPFPWPRKLGLLLLAPPSWASVNAWEEFSVEMPHGTGALPVTEVSWSDACAFAEWATLRTGGSVKLRLPIAGEWMRTAHGNHPPGGPSDETAWDFPWGKSLLRHACNNAELYGGARDPVLQPVGLPYRDNDANGVVRDGTSVDGIFDLAGNAREWVLDQSERAVRVNGIYRVHYDAQADRGVPSAPTKGGSYLTDLPGCNLVPYVDARKDVREVDLGFRLVAEVVM